MRARVLARVEQGESFTVTVAGREVARLVPSPAVSWIPADRMMAIYDVPVDSGFWDDINRAREDSLQIDPWNRSA